MKKNVYYLIITMLLLLSFGCSNKTKELKLKDDLNFEINEKIKLFDLFSNENEVEILSESKDIDTTKIGEKELIVKFKDNNEEYEGKFKINIVDTKQPVIECKKELNTKEETKIDLLKDVKVTDNSNEKIKATVEGDYDFNKEGTYKLKYVAIDSSNNKTEEEFALIVKKVDVPKQEEQNNQDNKTIENKIYTTVGNTKVYFGKYKLEADTDDFSGSITLYSDGTASSTGNIYINGKFVRKNLKGTWTLKAKSVTGINGGKVDGIFFIWNDGNKSTFGLSNKYFGDEYHGYKWISK